MAKTIDLREVDRLIDRILKFYGDKKLQSFDVQLVKADLKFTNLGNEWLGKVVKEKMEEKKLIVLISKPNEFEITPFGNEVLEQGGYLKYLEQQYKELDLEQRIKELTKESLELGNQNLKHIYIQSKYWWFILIITILISSMLGAYFQSLFTNL